MKWIVNRVTIRDTKRKIRTTYLRNTMLNPVVLRKTIAKTGIESSALFVFRKYTRISHRVVPAAITMARRIISVRLPSALVMIKYITHTISVGRNKSKKGIASGASMELVVGGGRNVRSLRRME